METQPPKPKPKPGAAALLILQAVGIGILAGLAAHRLLGEQQQQQAQQQEADELQEKAEQAVDEFFGVVQQVLQLDDSQTVGVVKVLTNAVQTNPRHFVMMVKDGLRDMMPQLFLPPHLVMTIPAASVEGK